MSSLYLTEMFIYRFVQNDRRVRPRDLGCGALLGEVTGPPLRRQERDERTLN